MIKKEQVVNLLKSMLNDENEQYITQFVDKISNVDEKQWKKYNYIITYIIVVFF